MPIRILFSAFWVIRPTIPGPILPPKSPAMARRENIAVPPFGKVFEEIKGKFGQLTKKEVGASFTEYQFEKSVYVRTVNDPTNNQPTVINIKVFYDWLPDNLNVGYRGISSKTKKSEVEQKLSDYWIVDKSDYTQTFQNQETFDNVKVYYDNNGYVEQIDYS